MTRIFSAMRACAAIILIFTVLLGGAYPTMMHALGKMLYPERAEGSLIRQGDVIIGSELIGQQFTSRKYFWSRPSASEPPYNPMQSTGSNLAATNPKRQQIINARIKEIQAAHPRTKARIPMDMVMASASGLDPHISVATAQYQLARVARARGLKEEDVEALIQQHTHSDYASDVYAYVNVLKLNLALDALSEAGK